MSRIEFLSLHVKNILVSGGHRSGTTWTSKVLVSGKQLDYIREPFNLKKNREQSPLRYAFEYVSNEDPEERQIVFRNYFREFTTSAPVGNPKPGKLIKDPMALFSADWLHREFDLNIVILIRHPAAFAGSLKKKGWKFRFRHFLKQKQLLLDFLHPFEHKINYFLESREMKKDIIEHAILLWNIICSRISFYQQKFPSWIFVRHEDLSLNPFAEFENICSGLDLVYNNDIVEYIRKTTQSNKTTNIRRISSKNIYSWKERLTKNEIKRVRKGTEEYSLLFYNDSEW